MKTLLRHLVERSLEKKARDFFASCEMKLTAAKTIIRKLENA